MIITSAGIIHPIPGCCSVVVIIAVALYYSDRTKLCDRCMGVGTYMMAGVHRAHCTKCNGTGRVSL